MEKMTSDHVIGDAGKSCTTIIMILHTINAYHSEVMVFGYFNRPI